MSRLIKTIVAILSVFAGLHFIHLNNTNSVGQISSELNFPLKVTPNKRIDISKVMDYPMPHVIARYCKDCNISLEDAKIYEIELKRFLILAGDSDEGIDMLSSEVDNLWHTFLLFTREYQKFCNEMFGKFIHHDPVTDVEEVALN